MASAKEVAEYMLKRLNEGNFLYQEMVVYEIMNKFGEQYVYKNDNGNWAIGKDVLKEFRKLTEKTVVWERGGRLWRKRKAYDTIGKRQAY